MIQMQIKWERNSRALALEAQGKIKGEDIIPRTQTNEFPFDAATVRMKLITKKYPLVTVHIRGPKKTKKGWNGFTYDYAETCRINFGGEWQGKVNTAMDSNGDLCEDLTWLDVHNVVTKIKNTMGVK